MAETKPIQIFLCHASEDKAAVEAIYDQLKALGYKPWLDKKDLLPGQLWEEEIPKAIRASDFILIFLSKNSIPKRGYVQTEFKLTLDAWMRVPQGMIHTIPVRLDDSEIPDQFRKYQWCNHFEADGFETLLRVFPQPKTLLAGTREPFEPEMILIPAGEFLMGSDPQQDEFAKDEEQPQYRLYLPDYYLAKTPVTQAQYRAFVAATRHKVPADWINSIPPRGREDHPVVCVSRHDAMAYCRWVSEVTGRAYSLPSEAEWEKRARGTDGRIYPWGNQWDARHCNSGESGLGKTTSVHAYPEGASPYGLLNIAGNIAEWTRSLWGREIRKPDYKYPYQAHDGRENLQAAQDAHVVLRGGGFISDHWDVRCAYRYRGKSNLAGRLIGFRVVMPTAS
jgi:formylglycine-generating enzyme required for sulfatase activity